MAERIPRDRPDRSVANLAMLVQLHVSALVDGTEVYVVSDGAVWTLLKDGGGLSQNGTTILAPIAGAPKAGAPGAIWVRDGDSSSAKWAAQATWYIDPVNGNDQNNGLTPTTALKTHEEMRLRIGEGVINQATTVFLMNDFAPTNPVYIPFNLGESGSLTYQGFKTLTVVSSGTFSSVTPINALANQATQVDGPTGAVNAPAGNLIRIRVTSGAAKDALAMGSATGNSLGTQVRTSPFSKPATDIALAQSPPAITNPVAGDGFVVETDLIHIENLRVTLRGSGIGGTARLWFREVTLANSFEHAPVISAVQAHPNPFGNITSEIIFTACDVGRLDVRGDCSVGINSSKVSGIQDVRFGVEATIAACLVTNRIELNFPVTLRVDFNTLFQFAPFTGSAIVLNVSNSSAIIGTVAFFLPDDPNIGFGGGEVLSSSSSAAAFVSLAYGEVAGFGGSFVVGGGFALTIPQNPPIVNTHGTDVNIAGDALTWAIVPSGATYIRQDRMAGLIRG